MPKPDVVALTGGYRKTPFLQIGADIYCDTALICDVLEHRQPTPTLYPAHQMGLARIVAQWADETLFWAAMAYNLLAARRRADVRGSPDAPVEQWGLQAKVFGDDRAKMRVGMARLPAPDATAAYRSYLRRLSDMLEGQAFLLGAAPSVADFAAYHPLWFTRTRTSAMAGILDATPAVLAWMDRMAAIGHGTHGEVQRYEAIALCARSTLAVPRKRAVFRTSTASRWAARSASPPRASAPSPPRAN